MVNRSDLELGLKFVALVAFCFSVWSYFDQAERRRTDAAIAESLRLAAIFRGDYLPAIQRFDLLLSPYRSVGSLSDSSEIDDASIFRIYQGVMLRPNSSNYGDWIGVISFLDSVGICVRAGLCDKATARGLICGQTERFLSDTSRLVATHRELIGPNEFGQEVEKLCRAHATDKPQRE